MKLINQDFYLNGRKTTAPGLQEPFEKPTCECQ